MKAGHEKKQQLWTKFAVHSRASQCLGPRANTNNLSSIIKNKHVRRIRAPKNTLYKHILKKTETMITGTISKTKTSRMKAKFALSCITI